jgi:rubrerythrin
MRLQTASSVISFARELEGKSAKFYEDLAQRFAEGEDTFLGFAKENKKNVVQIERAYYGVITDAIEGCFAFDLESDDYVIATALAEKTDYSDALSQAIEMEETTVRFYTDATEQSQSLMADVPRAFMLIVRKRNDRLAKLRSL